MILPHSNIESTKHIYYKSLMSEALLYIDLCVKQSYYLIPHKNRNISMW